MVLFLILINDLLCQGGKFKNRLKLKFHANLFFNYNHFEESTLSTDSYHDYIINLNQFQPFSFIKLIFSFIKIQDNDSFVFQKFWVNNLNSSPPKSFS